MRNFSRFMGRFGTTRRNPNIFGMAGKLKDAATENIALAGGKSKYFRRLGTVAGTTALGIAGGGLYTAHRFREGLTHGMYPGSVMPMESGRFGIRTNNTPAGLSGVRFNFRRR